MTETRDPVVKTRVQGRILIVEMNRPEVRNAINAEAARLIGQALERLDADPALTIGIVTGSPDCFCTGMDLGGFVRGEKPRYGDRGFAGIARKSADKPLLAAVEGYAVAGGFEIALACDLIVASRDARFALPEVKRGLVAAAGALLRLPRRMPFNIVMEMALTGDFFDAEQMHKFGIINRLVEPGTALDAALALAQRIGENGPLAIAATKKILLEQQDWSLGEMWAKQEVLYRAAVDTLDAREGAAAFKEKRQPQWQGR